MAGVASMPPVVGPGRRKVDMVEGQQPLFLGAPEACIVGAHWVDGEGWRCRVQLRRAFEEWAECRETVYERLTTPELLQALEAELVTLRVEMGC